ncbi:MAG: 16S rRNA (guanine(527)-N(7))-methyltransferase RsmG [Deltaproteobacteria bacterium]|jgi:16S rRNA (guanine527-N7)-methyltransferase|nr:16S rRNA (guanine(527)-N(7))-methyltransferase RsmG [Deltaproteobacteria bacterium]
MTSFSASELISREFKSAGLSLSASELEKFVLLDALLREKKDELDLTRIDDPKIIIIKHYLDGALAAELLDPPEGTIMDLGAGAGFPGLPLAILRPQWNLLLAEPRLKRLSFMEEAVNLLKLSNVNFYPHKVTLHFDREVKSIVTRDFQPVSDTLILASKILPPGGRIYLMKGGKVDRELKEAQKIPEWSLFTDYKDHYYTLGDAKIPRRLISLQKKRNKEEDFSLPQRKTKPKITEIASTVNSSYRGFLKLLEGRYVKKNGETLVSGAKIIVELSRNHPHLLKGVIARRLDELKDFDFSDTLPVYLVRPEIFSPLDLFGTGPPLIIANTPSFPEWQVHHKLTGLTLFVPFQNPSNVGALIRTACAMGAEVVLLKEAANPYHPKALRASGPSVYRARILKGPSLAELSAADAPNIFALSANGRDFFTFQPPDSLGLVMGLEGPGLDKFWPFEKRLCIPMRHGVESLNGAAAGAMALAILAVKGFQGLK